MINLTREEAQQVLDVIERNIVGVPRYKATKLLHARLTQCNRCGKVNPAEIHTCTPQPEPEPVAWRFYYKNMWSYVDNISDLSRHKFEPLYTAPPQREWQGLTDEEIDELSGLHIRAVRGAVDAWVDGDDDFARAIEQALREKNT